MATESGALREALAKLKAELDHLAGAEYIIDRTVALLSLSSPIEPEQLADIIRRIEDRSIQRAHPPEDEVSTDEPFECVLCGAEAPTPQVYHNVTCPVADMALLLARPTPQASSEIREHIYDHDVESTGRSVNHSDSCWCRALSPSRPRSR